ncbi:hypothetical protein I549_1872 [Mycobacterium avium subsp. avium 2285 (R)]|nr:hypothetical protein I549_1872 [Mycobacterium avium subsp. avium 2285 (R)]
MRAAARREEECRDRTERCDDARRSAARGGVRRVSWLR